MPYEVLEQKISALTAEQQRIVYNLVLSLGRLNVRGNDKPLQKRAFGKFAGRATATFSDSWEMSEEELCSL